MRIPRFGANRVLSLSLAGLTAMLTSLGCSSPPYQGPRAPLSGAEVPPEVEYWRGSFRVNDGLTLYEQGWRPAGNARAAIVFVHGIKDHSSRFRELGVQFAHRGIAFYSFDLPGHGYSEGIRDHIDSIDTALDGLSTLVQRVRERQPKAPLFVMGHGFGATLAGIVDERGKSPTPLAGVILVAPVLRGQVNRGERFGTRLSAIFTPRSEDLTINTADWSSDPVVVAALKSDPLIYEGQPTAATKRELLRASDEIKKRASALTRPVLILCAGGDRLTPPELGRALHADIAATDKQIEVYDGLFHDIFHEPAREQAFATTLGWVNTHAAAALKPPTPAPK
ncbi:MAG TPA: alpha/beta hydrolase [Polyangia bacterium]